MLQESWSKAVTAASSVEQHAEGLVARLSAKAQAAPLSPEQAKKLASDVAAKLTEHRKELQGQVEAAVGKAMDKARMPTRAALRDLAERLTALEQKLAKAEKEKRSP